MKDLMIDLETLGSDYGAVITQIGACYFDRKSGEIGDTFLVNIDPKTATRLGFKIEPETVEWWFTQPNKTWLKEPRVPLPQALDQYREFSKKAKYVWSHATFDFSMLLDACFRLGRKPLNHYSSTRDIRTLMDLCRDVTGDNKISKKDDEYPEDAHDALADCKRQVQYCVEAMNMMRKKLEEDKLA